MPEPQPTTPGQITDTVLSSFDGCSDERLREAAARGARPPCTRVRPRGRADAG